MHTVAPQELGRDQAVPIEDGTVGGRPHHRDDRAVHLVRDGLRPVGGDPHNQMGAADRGQDPLGVRREDLGVDVVHPELHDHDIGDRQE